MKEDYLLYFSEQYLTEYKLCIDDSVIDAHKNNATVSETLAELNEVDSSFMYSNWIPRTIQISSEGQEYELYDYAKYGMNEVTNNAPGGPMPEPELFIHLYRELFDPRKGAIANELRQSLPHFLQPVQRKAMADYLAFEAQV